MLLSRVAELESHLQVPERSPLPADASASRVKSLSSPFEQSGIQSVRSGVAVGSPIEFRSPVPVTTVGPETSDLPNAAATAHADLLDLDEKNTSVILPPPALPPPLVQATRSGNRTPGRRHVFEPILLCIYCAGRRLPTPRSWSLSSVSSAHTALLSRAVESPPRARIIA